MNTKNKKDEKPSDSLLKIGAVAAKFGCSRATVLKWIAEGKLKCAKLSARMYRIPSAEVDRLTSLY